MKQHNFIIGSIVFIAIMVLIFWLWSHKEVAPISIVNSVVDIPSPVAPSNSATNYPAFTINIPDIPGHPLNDQDKQNITKIHQMTHAPISFWGKVIDQNGEPVTDATVHYSAANRYFGSGDKYEGSSDENGLFSITGINGMGLYVEVSKEGYYRIPDRSYHSFPQAQMPTKDKPAILELRKKGESEPLILNGFSCKFIEDGIPVKIDLRKGRAVKTTGADIQVQAWINNANLPKGSGRHYDWRCVITVPGGGLQLRTDQLDFEAPESGYQLADEIVMPANAERWQWLMDRNYYVKLASGNYARIAFSISPGQHSFTIVSYLNPTPGHRNLEYDPKLQANP